MRKKDKDQLDLTAADHILQNVFSACNQPPNAISLSHISSIAPPRCVGYRLAEATIILMLIVLLLTPFMLIGPKIGAELATAKDALSADYEIKIQSLMPVRSVSATLNDQPLPVNRVSGKHFSVNVQKNGILSITVTLMNNLSEKYSTNVSHFDQTDPIITRHQLQGDQFYVYVKDEESGVDFPGIYALTLEGERISPLSYEETSGLVVFPYSGQPLNLYLPDRQGNTLQAVLTPKYTN